jgi:phosphate starvation-inducible protein PhoH and related proteins
VAGNCPILKWLRISVPVSKGIESLFGTRDENIRLMERNLNIRTFLRADSLDLEGEERAVQKARQILDDYLALLADGYTITNSELNNFLRVVTVEEDLTLRNLYLTGKQRSYGKKVLAPKTINQRRYVDAIEKHDLTFGIGPAGTGKTYLAVAMAVAALLNKSVSKIILTRPAVEAGERLGFLPGTMQEKVDPYLRPLYDGLFDMLEADKVKSLIEKNVIEVAPIAFMRGRTLTDAFIIVDESQNCTPDQMKMILTRLGFNSRMVVTGDITQIDLPGGKRSGLIEVMEVLRGVEGVSFVLFDDKDVVRHSLVQRIVRAYEVYTEKTGIGRQMLLKLDEQPALAAKASMAPGPELQSTVDLPDA